MKSCWLGCPRFSRGKSTVANKRDAWESSGEGGRRELLLLLPLSRLQLMPPLLPMLPLLVVPQGGGGEVEGDGADVDPSGAAFALHLEGR